MIDDGVIASLSTEPLAKPHAAYDLLTRRLGLDGAATVLAGCLTAAGASQYPDRAPTTIVIRAIGLLQLLERELR